MFGFLSPLRPARKWRQSYARVCQYQHRLFGITSLPFLSYEATFLYQLAVDFRLIPELPEDVVTCCRLRKMRQVEKQPDHKFGSFAAAFGLILAGVKLSDDVQDSNRWFQRLLNWKYRRQIRKAHNFMRLKSPGLLDEIASCLRRHAQLETNPTGATLESAVVPTGDGFSAVFLSAAELFAAGSMPTEHSEFSRTFAQIGKHIGRAIISWDCAVDFEHDLMKGHFNPLRTIEEVSGALDMCRLELARAGWLCPPYSVSASVLESVIARVQNRQAAGRPICNPVRLERWGLLRQQGFAYARCDGCEALCAGAECVSACPDCCAAGCECVPWMVTDKQCGPRCGHEQPPTTPVSPKPETPDAETIFNGLEAVTEGALTPVGFVRMDGQRVPARTSSGQFIATNTRVRVDKLDQFGVHVSPLN